MKTTMWFLAGLLSTAGVAHAQLHPDNAYRAGVLLQMAQAYERVNDQRGSDEDGIKASIFIGYVEGVRDMGISTKFLCGDGPPSTAEQMVSTVKLYIEQRPQRWNEAAVALTYEALAQIYRCKQ